MTFSDKTIYPLASKMKRLFKFNGCIFRHDILSNIYNEREK